MNVLRLLTVDDEPHIHAGLDAIVDWQSLGYEHVGAALNGHEALRLLVGVRPHVILTDIRMPGIDGLELIAAIRRSPEPQPVIVVVSGYDEFEYARTALRFHVQDYLLKPIDEDDLARVLGEIRVRLDADERRFAEQARTVGSVRPPEGESAVRTLLAGKGDTETTAAARVEVGAAGKRRLAVLRLYRVRDDLRQAPLSASQVRHALESGKARDCARWVIDDGGVTALVLVPALAEESYRSWMKGLANAIRREIGFPIVLWASSPFVDIARIRDRLSTLSHCIAVSPPSQPGDVRIDCDSPARRSTAGLPVEGIIRALENGDSQTARMQARSAVEAGYAGHIPVRAVREWMTVIRVEVGRLIADIGGDSSVPDQDMRRVGERVYALAQPAILSVVEEYLDAAAEAVVLLRQANRDGVVALMRRRIERDFVRDLSIATMAEEYGMNAVYLGQLFRKRTGAAFRTALRRRRIREACRLLRDTDLVIPEVVRAIGYRDVDFFADQFKRETGSTPSRYREAGGSAGPTFRDGG